MFRGTIDSAAIYPREVVKAALRCNAAAVIFAHNHPSGVAKPSHVDRTITEKLVDALKLVEVRMLDHIVVSARYLYTWLPYLAREFISLESQQRTIINKQSK